MKANENEMLTYPKLLFIFRSIKPGPAFPNGVLMSGQPHGQQPIVRVRHVQLSGIPSRHPSYPSSQSLRNHASKLLWNGCGPNSA